MSAHGFPKEFGPYMLTRRLALGGMAELFLAKMLDADGREREVVVKRILPSYSEDEAFVKMFVDEATLTAKLKHPNIVQIYDFDVYDRQYYITMEFIHGEDLTNIIRDGQAQNKPLSVAQCVWLVIELARGLHYAHVKEHRGKPLNIIHRDVTPHNAMVGYKGEVKLMDFGIAKAAERSTKTQAGMVKGKVAYMSPEQARGKPLDPRSDLFALGIILWELLTNKRLFLRDSDFETLTAILKEEAPAPSRHRKGIDRELDNIILTALEKDRENRQASVEVFARDLTSWYYKNVPKPETESLANYMAMLYPDKVVGAAPVMSSNNTNPPIQHEEVTQGLSDAETILDGGQLNQENLAKALAENARRKKLLEAQRNQPHPQPILPRKTHPYRYLLPVLAIVALGVGAAITAMLL